MVGAALSANRRPRHSSLADVLELVLDHGFVITQVPAGPSPVPRVRAADGWVTIATMDTYVRLADTVHRLHPRATT